jgi:hypothetical protein
MESHIYIHPSNFVYNGTDEESQVVDKLHHLLSDIQMIYKGYDGVFAKENKFLVCPSVYSVNVYKGKSLFALAGECLAGEEWTLLLTVFADTGGGVSEQEPSIEEIRRMSEYDSGEENPTSMIVLNAPVKNAESLEKDVKKEVKTQEKYMCFDKYEIIYGETSWVTFRRQILGNHPEDANHFINECRRYFNNLTFHDNCIISLDDGEYNYLEACPCKIVYYLSVLNDKYFEVHKRCCGTERIVQPNHVLEQFSYRYCLDEYGSINRTPDTKDDRTFVFKIGKEKQDFVVFCDLHLKITHPDDTYRPNVRNFNPRIYFNVVPHADFNDADIYVGSIGRHL